MIGGVNHAVGSKHRPIADGNSTKAVDPTAIIEIDVITEFN